MVTLRDGDSWGSDCPQNFNRRHEKNLSHNAVKLSRHTSDVSIKRLSEVLYIEHRFF